MTSARSRVALRVGDRTLDVAIPQGLPVYEVLREAGVDLDDAALTIVDSAGHPVDLYSATGDQLPDGTVLHVLRRGSRVRAAAGHASGDPAVSRPTGFPWWLGVAGAAAVVLVATVGLQVRGAGAGGGSAAADRWALAAALGLAGLALAVARSRPGVRGASWPTVVCALAGAAAGAATVDPSLPGAGRLAVVTALTGASVVAAARWAAARRARADDAEVAGVVLGVTTLGAVVTAVALLAGLPGALAAAVLLGGVPLALRALPTLVVDVPDEQLIDTAQVARTVSAVRTPVAPPLGPVNGRLVHRTVLSAERRRDAGVVAISLAAPVVAPALLLDPDGPRAGGPAGWAGVVACLLVALALALQPRTSRGALARWAPRACAALLLLELAVLAGLAGGDLLPATLAALVLGLLVVAVSIPLGRGWRSVGFSRLADNLEGLATVLALPAALVAAGAIDVLSGLASR